MKKFAPLLLLLPVIISCSKTDVKDAVVRIGKTTITKTQYDAFDKITKLYPTEPGEFYPGFRAIATQLVETELIYNNAPAAFRDSLKKSADWKLKQQYYPAQMFLMDFLSPNLGIPEAEIASYYAANKESFKVTVTNDSTKKDSTYYNTLETVKGQIIDTLFLAKNQPDSTFLSRFDSLADQKYKNEQWLQNVRQTLPAFFMKKIYAEVQGKAYPDSISEVFGEGKYITKPELDVILGWIPESRRSIYEAPERQRELIEWLVKWKLFSAYALNQKLLDIKTHKITMDWAWKTNVVYAYVNTVLAPATASSITIDSAMVKYAYFDDNGYTTLAKDDNGFSSRILAEKNTQIQLGIERTIMSYRKEVPVTFLQSDVSDVKSQNTDSLFTVGETLRDSGKADDARNIFLTLTKEFASTKAGLNAFVELAKLQTEQQLYSQAITNYRRFLLDGGEADKRCNTFFMIGFIYDEYLDKPVNAEANYKWVLKNAPDCELADDAEFMMLHLSEPMSSVEELRDEATRQGRKVDASDETTMAEEK